MRPTTFVFFLSLGPIAAFAAEDTPAWTRSFRVDIRLLHDTNLFLQEEVPLAAGQSVRSEPARADASELVAAATASVKRKPAKETGLAAEFGYSFEWHRFDTFRGESHRDHRLTAGLREATGTWLTEAKLNVLEVNGSDVSPAYNEQGGVPAIGGEPVRARRAQTVVNASGSALWHPASLLQLRGHFVALSQDFHTRHDASRAGCANYVDRAQAIAGLDAGRLLFGDVTLWTSLRTGRQWQANLLNRPDNFTNTVVRPLVGLEGKLASTLRLSAWAGPDYHRFTSERRAGTDAARMLPFFDTTASWTPTAADSITLGAREQLWLGSGGRSAYREFRGDAAWSHRFSKAVDSSLRCNVLHGNFAGFAATPRNDSIFTAGATFGEQLTRTLRLEAGVTREWSQTRIPSTAGRAYERWLGSLGATQTW